MSLSPPSTSLCLTHNITVVSLGHEQHTANQICGRNSLSAFTFPAIRQGKNETGTAIKSMSVLNFGSPYCSVEVLQLGMCATRLEPCFHAVRTCWRSLA